MPSPGPEPIPLAALANGASASETEEFETLDADAFLDDDAEVDGEPGVPVDMLDDFLDEEASAPAANGNGIVPFLQDNIPASPQPIPLEEFLDGGSAAAPNGAAGVGAMPNGVVASRTRHGPRSKTTSIEEIILTPPSNVVRVEPRQEITYASDDEALDTAPRISRRRWARLMRAAELESDVGGMFKGTRSSERGELAPADMRGTVNRILDTRQIDLNHKFFGSGKTTANWALRCAMYEAFISQSTSVDEPNAPPIKVVNKVDGTPPEYEFQYSNQMLYTSRVPDPELGHGCGCDGPCDPESTTCLCVKRQQLYFYGIEGLSGFQYRE